MTLQTNDIDIFIINVIAFTVGVLLVYYSKSISSEFCILKYIGYGVAILPLFYLLTALMGLSLLFPKEIGFVFYIFGLFYLPYIIIVSIPAITIKILGIEAYLMQHYNPYYKVIEFGFYILFWIIIMLALGYIFCKK